MRVHKKFAPAAQTLDSYIGERFIGRAEIASTSLDRRRRRRFFGGACRSSLAGLEIVLPAGGVGMRQCVVAFPLANDLDFGDFPPIGQPSLYPPRSSGLRFDPSS